MHIGLQSDVAFELDYLYWGRAEDGVRRVSWTRAHLCLVLVYIVGIATQYSIETHTHSTRRRSRRPGTRFAERFWTRRRAPKVSEWEEKTLYSI